MNQNKHRMLICSLLLALFAGQAHADPAQSEDVAYRMAGGYIAKSFQMAPTDHSGILGAGQAIRFLIPVTRGLDYVFLVGTDDMARDVDVYVYDEVGGLILDDRRTSKLAGVQFRSSYNGTAVVYLHMARANGLAAYTVLVGRRGVPKEGMLTGDGNPGATAPNSQPADLPLHDAVQKK